MQQMKRRALLAEGLAEEGMDKMPEFTILYNTSEGHKKIAEAVQEMWRKNLDVAVTLENVEFQVKLDREKLGDYPNFPRRLGQATMLIR